jgi:membrane-associated protein
VAQEKLIFFWQTGWDAVSIFARMIELFRKFVEVVLHMDRHLDDLMGHYGLWIYLILFLIIFCETGLVITPILPGDSLLFAVGAVAARPYSLNIALVIPLLAVAAILGDNVNYWAGRFLGPKVFKSGSRLLNRKHLERTNQFYEKYGGKTIVIARFVPIVRTFAPFVAGIGRMPYLRFISFSLGGGLLWIVGLTLAGYFFGNLTFVRNNFSLVILMIIFISILPAVIEFLRAGKKSKQQQLPLER